MPSPSAHVNNVLLPEWFCRNKRDWSGQPMMLDRKKMLEALRRVVQRMHDPLEVMLVCVR